MYRRINLLRYECACLLCARKWGKSKRKSGKTKRKFQGVKINLMLTFYYNKYCSRNKKIIKKIEKK